MFRSTLLLAAAIMVVPSHADETAVKKMIGDYASAFNAKNVDTVIGFWSENSVHIDCDSGERTEGRDAIREDIVEAFKLSPESRLLGRVDRIRFVERDVAGVEGQVSVTSPDEDPALVDFSAILVSRDGVWQIDTVEESATPAPSTSADALRELDWIVGRWGDQAESGQIENVFRWSDSNAFLIRSFSAELADGISQRGTQGSPTKGVAPMMLVVT